MKNILLFALLGTSVLGAELNAQATSEAETTQTFNLGTLNGLFDFLIGDWVGCGTQTIFRIGSFSTNDGARVPNGFTEMNTVDFNRVEGTGVIHMFETNTYWEIEQENNLLSLNAFRGLGYAKLVQTNAITSTGTLPMGSDGFPICQHDPSKPTVHQETGYIIAYTDQFGATRMVKMINIPRGLTTLAHGTFAPGAFEFDTDDRFSDFGIVFTLAGTRAAVNQRNFHQRIEASTPDFMEYDEFFRMDQTRTDGTRVELFHRERAMFRKTSSVPMVNIFA